MDVGLKNLLNISNVIAPDTKEMYDSALSYLNAGQLEQGKSQLIKLIEKSPGFSFARNDLGAILIQNGEVEIGLRLIESACEIAPNFLPFSINLIKALMMLNSKERARILLAEIIPKHPSNQDIISLSGMLGVSLPEKNVELIQQISVGSLVSEQSDNSPGEVNLNAVKGRIAVFYDEPGWAWWHRSHNLKTSLKNDFLVDILPLGQFFDQELYDFCLVYDHCVLHLLPPISPSKLIIGNSCPKMLPDFIQTMKRTGCVAGVVNNKFAYEEAKKHLSSVYLCQNGVNTNFFYPSPVIPNKFSACWVGNSGSMGNKGLDLIQEACIKANINLIYVDAKEKLKIGERVAGQEEIRDRIYHNASVYICASEFEGTPNPGLEALSCGLGIVSTSVGNMPELVVNGWNGYIVERNVQSIVNALEKLREMDRTGLRIASRVSVLQGWDWQAQSIKYGKMFMNLFESRPTSSLVEGYASTDYAPSLNC